MKPTKIITHDGIWHADEVTTISLLYEVFGYIPVVRTRTITQEDIEDPEIWVLDVSSNYNPLLGNFDHHHNKDLPASCMLVLEHLKATDEISEELYEELKPTFDAISQIDCSGWDNMNGFQVNSLIKDFNFLPEEDKNAGWNLAILCMTGHIRAAKNNVNMTVLSKEIWDNGENVNMWTRYCSKYPVHWKRYDTHSYLIIPEEQPATDELGQKFTATIWKLMSINSNDYPIEATGKETFIHNGKFLAIYNSLEDAVEAANLSVSKIKNKAF